MSNAASPRDHLITVASGLPSIVARVPELQRLAQVCGQPGSMHGLELLLGSHFSRRKHPLLVCFSLPGENGIPELQGAVLLLEYRAFGLPTGLFATGDAFGVRTVVGPSECHSEFCLQASRFLVQRGARLVLATWRVQPGRLWEHNGQRFLYAVSRRTVQDTLPLAISAEATLQTLGKRTRTHMRSARRHFDRALPDACLMDATAALAVGSDALLQQLNEASLDVIQQSEFDHLVRSLCRSPGGFVMGLYLHGQWIALVGGWRQGDATWIEWQCNGRGFEKLSLGSVLRTYLFEKETERHTTRLGFHGGTSHSMLHRFACTPVADLLVRRPGLVTGTLVRLLPWLCKRWPQFLQRGNFLWNALCTPGLTWTAFPPDLGTDYPQDEA